MAKADGRAEYKQSPVSEERGELVAVTLLGQHAEKMRGFIPRTQPFGATAAVLRYDAASRIMATAPARWLRAACVGYSDDFGIIAEPGCTWDSSEGLFSDEPDFGIRP